MNGVITDDEELHEIATKKVFGDVGINLSSKNYQEICLGRTDIAAFKDLFEKFEISEQSVEDLIARKSAKYQKLVEGNLKVYPGVLTLIDNLYKKYTLALTSSSTYDEVEVVLNQLGIKDMFQVIVTSKDVKYGKPDPEPYILTAKKLRVSCENCLVIEDSANGVLSAKRAGMICIAIPNTENSKNLSKADRIINSYLDLTEEFIEYYDLK